MGISKVEVINKIIELEPRFANKKSILWRAILAKLIKVLARLEGKNGQ